MKVFFKAYLASLLAGLTFVFFLFLLLLLMPKEEKIIVRNNSILRIALNGTVQERAIEDPFAAFSMGTSTLGLNEIIMTLKAAKDDENIKGVYLEFGTLSGGMASLREIRDAINDFKTSGKFVWSYSDLYTQANYYVASVSDSIFLNPSGYFDWHGMSVSQPYLKRMFEKIGVEPVVVRGSNNKFKSAVEPFILSEMSAENRTQLSTLLDDLWGDMKADVAESRQMTADSIQNIADGMKAFIPKNALALGMVDQLIYKSSLNEKFKKITEARSENNIPIISHSRYAKSLSTERKKDEIAIVYAQGDIVTGEGDESSIGPERFAEAIRKAANDDDIKAIVLRVNSPGGSALGSDIIHNELQRARNKKPVIVSMGDYAASGGYFISAPADSIVAHPTTITGSIGVFMLYFTAQELLEDKIGIQFSTVKTADMADVLSANRGLTPEEYKLFQTSVDQTYGDFIQRVKNGRGLDSLYIDSIGQGRVWSGLRAKQLGLVDALGGLQLALDIAAKKAGIDGYSIKAFPKQKNKLEQLLESFGEVDAALSDKLLKERLGTYYETYMNIQHVMKQEGMMMRMPVDIIIQ